MAKKIKGITIEIDGDTQPLNKALEGANKQSRDLQGELRQVERLLKLDPKNTELLAQKQKLLTDAVSNTKDKLDTLREAEKQVQEQFKRGEVNEEQYRALQREIIKTEQELKGLEKQLRNTGMTAEKLGQGLQDAGKKMTDIGKDLSKKVTAPIIGAGVAALKFASDFEDALAKVSTLADTTQVSMEDLKAGILDISNASGIAATEISGSVYDALSAGVETADVLKYVETNVMLVKAGFTDMGVAIDATSTVLNAYGDAAFDVTKIGDILVKTQDEGKISVDELGKNMGRVIPTAASLGINLDQLGASYAILTAKGQNASIATTNLNSMLGELGKTGSKADKALREMAGKSFKELVAEGKTVGDALGLLDEYAKNAGLSLSDMFGSTTAGAGALTLLSGGVDAFNEKVDIMNNSTGTMAENFEKLQTPSEQVKISLNKIKNSMIEFGAIIMPVLSKAAEWITKVADKLAGMDEYTRTIIVAVAGIAAAIGPLLTVFGPLIAMIGSLITGLGAMSAAMTGGAGIVAGLTAGFPALGAAIAVITGPIGLVIAAIAVLVAAGVLIYKNWDKIKETLDRVWGAIVDFFTKTIPEAINTGLKWFSELPGKVAKFMNELPGKIGYALGVALGKIIQFGIDAINWAIAEVPKFIANVIKFYMELPGKIWDQLKASLQKIGEWGRDLISWARGNLPGIISNIVSFFRELPGKLWEIGRDVVKGLWDGISSMVGWIRSKISDFVGGIVSGVKGVLGIRSPSRIFMDIGENVSLGLAKGIADAKNAVDSAVSGLVSPQINLGLGGAGAVAVPAGAGDTVHNYFHFDRVSIRSDSDIEKLAEQLYDLQRKRRRSS